MKYLLLAGSLALLAFSSAAQGSPADTVAGHAHLVRQLSQQLCTRISNDHTTAFNTLTSPQAMQLTQQLFTEAMQQDSVAVIALMNSAVSHNISPQQVGRALGRDVVLTLGRNCLAANPLLVCLAKSEQGQQAIAAQQAASMSVAEQKALQPIAAAVCTQLASEETKMPFARLSLSQRQARLNGALQKAFRQYTPKLTAYYGAAPLDKKLRSGEIDRKIGSLLPTQGNCVEYVLLLNGSNSAK